MEISRNKMNAKQKIVADRILSRLKRWYNGYYGQFMGYESITSASGLIEVCESSPEELVIDCAEGVYEWSTIYKMRSEYVDTAYRIWCAIEDYVWNEWNKWKSNNEKI